MPEIGATDQAGVFPNMDIQDIQDKTQAILCILYIHVKQAE
jgi:hypothetical protein